jgi:type IV fimbrial biogenesis protein FimT
MNRNRQTTFRATQGFTLIELMITMVIAAILLTQAVPSFRAMIANNRITSHANELVTAINYARSEAAKLNVRMVLCRSANPTSATPSCGGTAKDWTTGWLLFTDRDGNATYQATDTLVLVGNPISGGIEVHTNTTSNNNLEINANGSTNEGGNTATFAVCDDRDGDGSLDAAYGKEIRVQPSGHIQTVTSPITTCNPA